LSELTAAISILSFGQRTSTAALVGPFTSDDTNFLAQHLEELPGNIVLDCEHLDDLDASSAAALVEFHESRRAHGFWVFFRGIPPRCHEKLLRHASRREISLEPVPT